MFQVSHVKCQASLVTCHLSHVTWHVSPDDHYIQLHLKKHPRIFDNTSEGVLVIDIDLKNKIKKCLKSSHFEKLGKILFDYNGVTDIVRDISLGINSVESKQGNACDRWIKTEYFFLLFLHFSCGLKKMALVVLSYWGIQGGGG